MRQYRFVFILLAMAFTLTACREQTDYFFYANGSWRFKNELTVDKALIDLGLGFGGLALGEQFGIDLPDSALDSGNWIELTYGLMTDELKRQGYEARWANAGETYIIQIEGRDYDQFRSLGGGFLSLEALGDGSYHLRIDVSGLMTQFGVPEMPVTGLEGLFTYEREVNLHARKIISSNADQVRGGTATWRGMKNVDVVFVPLSPFSLDGILPAVGGLLALTVVISIAVSLARRGAPCPECGKRVRKGQEICPNCGGYMASYNMTDV
jgi:hypothetical protein